MNSIIAPGRYKIDNEQYHEGEGISRSDIVRLIQTESPQLYYQERILDRRKSLQSHYKDFGNAVHIAIMEPELFEKTFAIIPKLDMRRTENKALKAELIEKAEGKIILDEEDYEKIQTMRESFFENPVVKEKLKASSVEQSYYWRDETTNMLCKCRPDFTFGTPENFVAFDIKTTSFEKKKDLENQILDAGIFIQAAMIIDGIKAVDNIDVKEFVLIFIQKEYPHNVFLKFLDEASIDLGRDMYKNALKQLKLYYENPAMWQMPEEIGIPFWAFDKLKGSQYVSISSSGW